MAAGGDGYEVFKGTETVIEAGGLEELVMNYISQRGTVAPKEEGRIIEVDQQNGNYVYTVEEGDYLAKISRMFNVKVDAIVETNNMESRNMIYVGQKLVIPTE